MDTQEEFTKRPADAFIASIDIATWPMAAGDSLVASNARGSLGLAVYDEDGISVTSAIAPDAPWILSGTKVAFWLLGGAIGRRYRIVATAPTQQGELLSGVAWLQVFA